MKTPSTTPRYTFLEGLRAVAMLIVLNFHACSAEAASARDGVIIPFLQRYSLHGQVGVVVFIVLSGYCLMLPVVTSRDGALRGGIAGFFRRRSLRILPAYYAALTLSILLLYATTLLHDHAYHGIRGFTNVLTARNIVTHALLVHNLWFDTAFTLNGALWSVATEWQIYFVFALALLPLWRRFGIWATLLVAFIAGILPALLLPIDQSLYWARPWYLGLFALGMAGAAVNFSPGEAGARRAAAFPFRWLFLGSMAVLIVLYALGRLEPSWSMDTLIGCATISLIGFCIQSKTTATAQPLDALANVLLTVLERPFLIYLAGISYSVYLLQHIFFKGLLAIAESRHLAPPAITALNYFVAIPACLIASHWFARWFERPFVSHAPTKRLEPSASPLTALLPTEGAWRTSESGGK